MFISATPFEIHWVTHKGIELIVELYRKKRFRERETREWGKYDQNTSYTCMKLSKYLKIKQNSK